MDSTDVYKSPSPMSSEAEKESAHEEINSNSRNHSHLRHPRQKYCLKWEKEFPWLKASKADESLGFCMICQKRLVCKKSHLERHELSFKHQRLQSQNSCLDEVLLQSQIVEETSEEHVLPISPEFMECENKGDAEEVEFAQVTVERNYEHAQQDTKESKITFHHQDSNPTNFTNVNNLNRLKLLKRIDRDRQDLNNFYNTHVRSPNNSPRQYQQQQSQQPQRDRTELFFDSVCAGVKALPPKLAAEAINRISQVMTEFDLRAICEREALENSVTASAGTPMVVASSEVTSDVTHGSLDGMPRIVYTIQPKLH